MKINPFRNLRRKSTSEVIVHLLVSFVFMIVAVSYLYILVWAVIAGCKTHTEIVMQPFGLPEVWNWSHYKEVFRTLEVNGVKFIGMFMNSLWFSVVPVLFGLFVTVTFAYVCAMYEFPGRKLISTVVLVVITLPIYGTGGATYRLYHNLGVIDNYMQAFIVSAFSVQFLYFTAFFKNLSWTYAEAALMDGANDFQIYHRVMLPQTKALFGALFLTNWITSWNSYEGCLVYFPNLPTLPAGIYQFNQEMIYRARLDILFAACVLITIPALILFTLFNKTITSNVSVGGIKG